MPTRDEFIAEVDSLLQKPNKVLAGGANVAWQMGRNFDEQIIKIPIETDGIQEGDELVIVAYPNEPDTYSILLIHRIAIARLDVVPTTDGHTNALLLPTEDLPSVVMGPHFHRWSINRRLIESASKLQRLRMAEPYTGTLKLMSALRWFCGEAKIVVPHDVQFELPRSEKLI